MNPSTCPKCGQRRTRADVIRDAGQVIARCSHCLHQKWEGRHQVVEDERRTAERDAEQERADAQVFAQLDKWLAAPHYQSAEWRAQ